MTQLDDIYNEKILELAAAIPNGTPLENPDATASAHSKLCGSTIKIGLNLTNGQVSEFGQTVRACLLGQAAASVVGREIIGTTAEEFRAVSGEMRAMLKEKGPPPGGRWADLGLLAPVRDYPHRHASTLLVFEAVEKALDEIAAAGKPASARRTGTP